jgi:hypothetical protein
MLKALEAFAKARTQGTKIISHRRSRRSRARGFGQALLVPEDPKRKHTLTTAGFPAGGFPVRTRTVASC